MNQKLGGEKKVSQKDFERSCQEDRNKRRVAFNEEERKLIQRCAADVWQYIGGDCLQALAEEKGKNVDTMTISKKDVIELVCDASRLEEEVRKHRVSPDLIARIRDAGLDIYDVVRPAFTYTRYGM